MSKTIELYVVDIPAVEHEVDVWLHDDGRPAVPAVPTVEGAFDEFIDFTPHKIAVDLLNRVAFHRMDVLVYKMEVPIDQATQVEDAEDNGHDVFLIDKKFVQDPQCVVGKYHLANVSFGAPKKANWGGTFITYTGELMDINHLKSYFKVRGSIRVD